MSAGWNHNAHYHRELLRHVPRPCRRALDVGCGTGELARPLARARALLRPGGVLALIGLDRARSPAHAAVRSAPAFAVSLACRLVRARSPADRRSRSAIPR